MNIEQIRAENSALGDSIVGLIEEYIKNTGLAPCIEIVWHSSIGTLPRPVVYVEVVVK